MKKHIIKVNETIPNEREGYVYRRLISQDEQPYNFLHIAVDGTHKARRVVHGIKNYFVLRGQGSFTVEGEELSVEEGTLIVINPGEVYSYTGTMDLIEFNIQTDGQIAHEDIE